MRRRDFRRLLFFAALLAMPSTCFADDIPKLLFNLDFLKTYNWVESEPIDRVLHDWQHFTGDQSGGRGFRDKIILKTKSVEIAGLKFNGSMRRYNKSGKYEIVLITKAGDYKATTQNLSYCNNIMRKYTSIFGPPKNLVDISDDTSQDIATIDEKGYWDINQTRLQVNCFATKIYAGFLPLISIVLGHKDNVNKIYDAVFLKCDRKKIGLGALSDKAITEEPPFTLIIDQNRKNLRSRTANIGKTITYGERKIVSVQRNKKKNVEGEFMLDRYSGSYIWEIRVTSNNGLKGAGYRFWGDCVKIQNKKKF